MEPGCAQCIQISVTHVPTKAISVLRQIKQEKEVEGFTPYGSVVRMFTLKREEHGPPGHDTAAKTLEMFDHEQPKDKTLN